jgi:predicted RNase H-like HicB family nuclease
MADPMSTYTVIYERDETEWWVATVRGVRGCHTQGRTIREARRRIREALGLFVDDADVATLEDEVKLPAEIRRVLKTYQRARSRCEELQEVSKGAAEEAARALAQKMGLSVRDMGSLLDLSHQRVQQIISKGNGRRRRKPARAAQVSGTR